MAQSVHRPGPPLGVVAAGGAVALALIAAAVRPPWEFGEHGLFADSPEMPTLPTAPRPESTPGPIQPLPTSPSLHWGLLPWILLAIVALALVLAAVWWFRHRVRSVDEPEPETVAATVATALPDLPTLQRGAVAADERLLAIGDPTDAIVAAWLALEEAAASSGVSRPPAATPTEFTAAVLQDTGAPPEPVRTLLGLYLRARFAARGADAEDLTVARGCVRALADHWSAYAADRAETYAADPSASAR